MSNSQCSLAIPLCFANVNACEAACAAQLEAIAAAMPSSIDNDSTAASARPVLRRVPGAMRGVSGAVCRADHEQQAAVRSFAAPLQRRLAHGFAVSCRQERVFRRAWRMPRPEPLQN